MHLQSNTFISYKKSHDPEHFEIKKKTDNLNLEISKYQGVLFPLVREISFDIDSSLVLTDEFKKNFKKLITNQKYLNETSGEANALFLKVVSSFLNESEFFYENITNQIKYLKIRL